MEHVFIARHGDYDRIEGNLTPQGIEQITGLANQIKLILSDQPAPLIFTSQSQRAMESSEILKATLGARVPEQCPYINNQFLREEDIAKIDSWVDRVASTSEPLILVTHVPVLEKYVPHFAAKHLGDTPNRKWDELPKGGAYHFDLIAKTVQRLPSTNLILPNRQTRQGLESQVLGEDEEKINAEFQLASQERVFPTDADWLYLRNTESQLSQPTASLAESRLAKQPEPLPASSPIAAPLSQSTPVYSIARRAELKKTAYQFVLLSSTPFDKKHFVDFLRTNLGEKDAIDVTNHNWVYKSGAHSSTLSFMTVMDPNRQTLLVSSPNAYGINATKALIDKAIGSQKPKS